MKNILTAAHNSIYIQIGIVYLRYLLGLSFILPAIYMNKLSGKPMFQHTDLNSASKLEQLFYIMSSSGLYWKFIGWYQVLTGVLLVTQRFAKLGALLFFAMIFNVFLLTLSFGFMGTPQITGLMMLASVLLIVWDADTFKYIIMDSPTEPSSFVVKKDTISKHYYWELLGLLLLIITVILASNRYIVLALFIPFFTGILALVPFFIKKLHRQ